MIAVLESEEYFQYALMIFLISAGLIRPKFRGTSEDAKEGWARLDTLEGSG